MVVTSMSKLCTMFGRSGLKPNNIWGILTATSVAFVLTLQSDAVASKITINSSYFANKEGVKARTFTIDHENDTFRMDGEPFHYVAGSIHYFRSPHQLWREKLRTMRAAGLNTLTTYVEWSFHEPEKDQYLWTGDKDLVKFIEMAQEEGLYVILRPGPYICAERDMGGFPYWLLSYHPSIKLRTSDEDYKAEVSKWFGVLMPKVERLFYGNGGPIIMVQVENEYGYDPACDKPYMAWLTELIRSWVKDSAVLFTTDGADTGSLSCGSTPGAYATVDFGPGTDIAKAWTLMRQVSKTGPLINSEFWPGWMTHWGENIARVEASKVASHLDTMLSDKANVNFYMFHGGSNFDYTAGANLDSKYRPHITSYDYDAPLTEAGDPTPKYDAIRKVLLKYNMSMPDYLPPAIKLKASLEPVTLKPAISLLSPEGRMRLGRTPSIWSTPPTMEALKQRAGLTLYETTLPERRPDPSELTVDGIKDRALVYVDGEFVGALSRSSKLYSLPIMADQGNILQILVENQGRLNFGSLINDFKGITGNVTFNSEVLFNWNVTSFPLEKVESSLESTFKPQNSNQNFARKDLSKGGFLNEGPVMYTAKFVLKENEVLDTYLDVSEWGKGLAWVNDYHLGRYWPSEGPQVTLFTPGVYLKKYPEENTIVLLELQKAPANMSIRFLDHPVGI